MGSHARPSLGARLSSEWPFLFIRPISRVLRVDGLFDVLDFFSVLVHFIRIQRNVYADLSAGAMPVCITIEIVPMPRVDIAAAVTGHSLQQFGNFLGDLISFRCVARKKRGRKSGRPRTARNGGQTPGLAHGKKEDQRYN